MDTPGCLFARMEFLRRQQSEDETFDEFVEALTELSRSCDYGSLQGMMIRDIFVINLHPQYAHIQKNIMQSQCDSTKILTLNEALMLAKVTTFTINEIDPVYEPRYRPPREPRTSSKTSAQSRLEKFKRSEEEDACGSTHHGR